MRSVTKNCNQSILFIFVCEVSVVILYTGASSNKPENGLARKLTLTKQLIIWNRFIHQKLEVI
jgi:hypothetical protein